MWVPIGWSSRPTTRVTRIRCRSSTPSSRASPSRDRERVVVEPDRRAAIGLALAGAERGDVVVIAGKGHETTQTIGAVVHDFDDRVVARELMEARS